MSIRKASAFGTLVSIALLSSGLLNCSSSASPDAEQENTGKSSETLRSTSPLRDYNKDGFPDLLWLNQLTREVDAYFLVGTLKSGGNHPVLDQVTRQIVRVGSGWVADGSADIDLNGSTDILFHDTNHNSATFGQLQAWFMSGTDRTGFHSVNIGSPTGSPATLGPNELIGALGDIDKNTTTDFVTYTPGVSASVWFMSGTDRKSTASIPATALPTPFTADWELVSAADINVDGYLDLVWYSPVSGNVQVNFIQTINNVVVSVGSPNFQFIRNRNVGGFSYLSLPAPWSVTGTADINQDGYADLIAHNQNTGVTTFYYMTGTDYFDQHTLLGGSGTDVTVLPNIPVAD